MGRRGPAPTPTEVKLKAGETRPSRINRREPNPRGRQPVMPRDMDAEAKVVWRQVLREMPPGVIRSVDGHVLRCFCEAVSAYQTAAGLMARTAPLIKGVRHGDLITNPIHRVVRDHRDAIRLFAREFGLSPSARAGLSMEISPDLPDIVAELGLPPRLRVLAEQAADDAV